MSTDNLPPVSDPGLSTPVYTPAHAASHIADVLSTYAAEMRHVADVDGVTYLMIEAVLKDVESRTESYRRRCRARRLGR